jgi:hypothetical protein
MSFDITIRDELANDIYETNSVLKFSKKGIQPHPLYQHKFVLTSTYQDEEEELVLFVSDRWACHPQSVAQMIMKNLWKFGMNDSAREFKSLIHVETKEFRIIEEEERNHFKNILKIIGTKSWEDTAMDRIHQYLEENKLFHRDHCVETILTSLEDILEYTNMFMEMEEEYKYQFRVRKDKIK